MTGKRRTLIRVVRKERVINQDLIWVVIPSWNPHKDVALSLSELPPHISETVKPGDRLFARVNTSAPSHNELEIEDFEASDKEGLEC